MRQRQILWGCILLISAMSTYAVEVTILNVSVKKIDFEVNLAANPTTGYQWSVLQYDKKLLKLTSSTFERSKTNRIGAGGEMHFVFSLQKGKIYPASTEMKFQYARSWEQGTGVMKTVKVNFIK